MADNSQPLGVIGNCAYIALASGGSIEWLCWPRPDSSFVFGPLLDREKGGAFTVEGVGTDSIESSYLANTNVLRTVFTGPTGSFELLDFAPRFILNDRSFKPSLLVRILRPLEGDPRVRIRCRPVADYGRVAASSWAGSNHIEYGDFDAPVRLTTNVPLAYVYDERPFLLDGDRHLAFTYGEPLEEALEESAERFLEATVRYWRDWVTRTRIPREFQHEVIRSALVLKLHQYEDTGALLAAPTTSLAEYPGAGRNWDYRYCWLRDSYFTLDAFDRLGHSGEMERFLVYLRNRAEEGHGNLQPVYTIAGDTRAEESELAHLAGHNGEQPVRIGNQAFEHVQNDVYGEMILAVGRLLIDARFVGSEVTPHTLRVVTGLLGQIERRLEEADGGPWEFRGVWKLHGFTLLMHWAGARRAAEVAAELGLDELRDQAETLADRARDVLESRCWNAEVGALTQTADEPNLDAAMLVAVLLGFFEPDDPRAESHVLAIREALSIDGFLLRRYRVRDDFGEMEAAFAICSFWLVEALAVVGHTEEARALFDKLLALHNGLGLYSEDFLPGSLEQSGNFPQTYTHVGLINAAFRLSRRWD